MKRNIDQIRQDLKHLSSTEFEKKYPGVKAEKLKGLSDADLEKVAGGWIDVFTGAGPGSRY